MKILKYVCSIGVIIMTIIMSCCMMGCDSESDNISSFYDAVYSSQEKMDIVADSIYSNWYNAIYKDYFNKDIDIAIASAITDNEENIDFINSNETTIQDLYKKIKNSDLSSLIQEVMQTYSDYYEFVINVSGSFKSYSASMESLKKELASALKKLKLEL